MKDRKYYEMLFKDYPDVVDVQGFQKMLNGIGDVQARRLIRENRVKHFMATKRTRMTYYIPKVWVIDYILSEHYQEYKMKLKSRV